MSEPTEVADAVVAAIHSGDLAGLRQLLADHPVLALAPLGGRHGTRTLLHVVTDWPGYFPNGPETVRILVKAGAHPDPGPDRATRPPCTGRPAATTPTSPPPSLTPAPTSTPPTGPSAPRWPTPSAMAAGTSPGSSWPAAPT
jgi:hypothetical protein